jgi:thioredoxin-related protein
VAKYLLLVIAIAALSAVSCSKRETAQESPSTKDSPSAKNSSPAKDSASAKSGWLTSYEQAQQEAKANHKLMLMDFTGSDWCGWCIVLEKEVFSKPKFHEYAGKNLVLLELDFPRSKQIAAETVAQNERLARQYQIEGFPTIVVLNGNGKQVGQLGYIPGGPDAFIAELEKLPKD